MEKTILSFLTVLALGLLGSAARADSPPPRAIDGNFELLDAGKACHHVGMVCLSAGDEATTMAAEPMVSRPGGHSVVAPVPKFVHPDGGKKLWSLQLDLTPRRSWTGNAIFLVFDAADPSAIAEGNYAAMFQAPIKAGKALSARMILDGEDGIHADHTYKIRVVQIISGKEMLLAEGDLTLL